MAAHDDVYEAVIDCAYGRQKENQQEESATEKNHPQEIRPCQKGRKEEACSPPEEGDQEGNPESKDEKASRSQG